MLFIQIHDDELLCAYLFSGPDVKADTRPSFGSMVLLALKEDGKEDK